MNTLLSDDERVLEEACRTLLGREWPLESALRVFGAKGIGHCPELWATLAASGWFGLPFDGDVGGGEASLIELGLVCREAGFALIPSSYYSTMFAALLIDRLATSAQRQALLQPIVAGRSIATVAYGEPHAADDARLFTTVARPMQGGWQLDGDKAFVPHANLADMFIVLARIHRSADRDAWGLFAVPKDLLSDSIVTRSALGAEKPASIEFRHLHLPYDALLGGEQGSPDTLDVFYDVVEQATALQSMEMVGGTSAVLGKTIAYVSERHQHGRPIGSNQAVQHLLANVQIQLDGARVAALQALYRKARKQPARREVSIAKIAAGQAYSNCVVTAHQVWGSMGYARETGLYLWTERAKVTDLRFGTRRAHLRHVAEELGL